MAIARRGNRWQVYVRGRPASDGTPGTRYRLQVETETQAKAIEAELLIAVYEGKTIDLEAMRSIGEAGKRTLQQVYDVVYARFWKGMRSERHATHNAGEALDFFGRAKSIDSLSDDDFDRYLAHLEKIGNSNATINRKIAAVSKMVGFSVKRGWRTKGLDFSRRKETAGRIRFLSAAEENTLLSNSIHVIGRPDLANLWRFLIDTGCRVSEALGLQWKDFDYAKRTVTFWQTKNDEPRTIPLTARAFHLLEFGEEPGRDRPFPMDYADARSQWDRVRSLMKLHDDPQWVIHMLRHTCLSRLAQASVSLQVIQQWAGHKTISVTLRYAHLCPSNLLLAAQALEPAAAQPTVRIAA